MLKFAKYLYHKTAVGKYMIDIILNVHRYYRINFIEEKKFVKQKFKKRFKKDLDLENPKSLNEKMQWLKLYDRTPLHTICADKFKVRDYVTEKIGPQYLIDLVFQSYNANDVIPSNFPDFPFIIKANHDSSGGIIVKNKDDINWKSLPKHFKKLLRKNYYKSGKEWQYKNIEPCIIGEKLLINTNGELPMDYKIHCFHGKVEVIQVDIDRFTNHKRNFYDQSWNLLPFSWSLWKDGQPLWNTGRALEKPKNLDEMISVAEKLSEVFKYVRIDLYDFENKIYFGEVTFHHGSGMETIFPEEWNYKLGDLLNLKEV